MLGRRTFCMGTVLGLLGAGRAFAAGSGSKYSAPSADKIEPLKVGDAFPSGHVKAEDGTVVKLYRVLLEQPAVIVFYRGHWCPFCMKHLAALQEIAATLEGLGVKLVALTPDKPEHIAETRKTAKLSFPIYSDGEMEMAQAMGVAYTLDAETAKRYKEQLVESTGFDLGQLPVPSVFLKDKNNKLQFVHTNPDYKVRLSNEELLAAVKKMLG